MIDACPLCAAPAQEPFLSLHELPVHGTQVFDDPGAARTIARGDQILTYCGTCGIVFNRAFEASKLDYSAHHEESQFGSAVFRAFANELADRWVADHALAGELVVEVGCGRAEFLDLLVERGAKGIGIDPGARGADTPDRRLIRDVLRPEHVPPETKAVVARHTLEHIEELEAFAADLAAVGGAGSPAPALLVEVPSLESVLERGAFWDLQYEHCTYFSDPGLENFMARAGYRDPALRRAYDGQYLLGDATTWRAPSGSVVASAPPAELAEACRRFGDRVTDEVARWSDRLQGAADRGERIALWGAGAKGLTFANLLRSSGAPMDALVGLVDMNPGLQGLHLGGTGHPIDAPPRLAEWHPDAIVVMNPVYAEEIAATAEAHLDVELADAGSLDRPASGRCRVVTV